MPRREQRARASPAISRPPSRARTASGSPSASRCSASAAIDGGGLAGEAGIVDAGAAADPVGAGAAEERGVDRGGDRSCCRCPSRRCRGGRARRPSPPCRRRWSRRSRGRPAPGPCVMSPVGSSSASSKTRRLSPCSAQICEIAAPPSVKFATICAVTSRGKAETPWSVTPWLPAKIATIGLSSVGSALPCQRARCSTSPSSVPSEPGGLVSVASRARTAATAASSPAGAMLMRSRISA